MAARGRRAADKEAETRTPYLTRSSVNTGCSCSFSSAHLATWEAGEGGRGRGEGEGVGEKGRERAMLQVETTINCLSHRTADSISQLMITTDLQQMFCLLWFFFTKDCREYNFAIKFPSHVNLKLCQLIILATWWQQSEPHEYKELREGITRHRCRVGCRILNQFFL